MLWFPVDVISVLALLHLSDVSDVADVSEVGAISIFRVEVRKVDAFLCIQGSCFEETTGREEGEQCLVSTNKDSGPGKLCSPFKGHGLDPKKTTGS